MPRYLIVAGVDFGTSFTKVVLRDNNTPGSNAVVVTFPKHSNGLLPSLLGIDGKDLTPPLSPKPGIQVPYLKMMAAHVANGETLEQTPVRIPAALGDLRRSQGDAEIVRGLLAFYFAHVTAATEQFIRSRSPWKDFDFKSGSIEDFLIFQLAVPTGLLTDSGATERLFRDAFIAGHELRRRITATLTEARPHASWFKEVAQVLSADRASIETRFEWQCLIYPEVAAAVQTVFRSPNARDGLYITMDVGAGTVDLNAFRRFTGPRRKRKVGKASIRRLDYYSAIVCPLGDQNLSDPHHAVQQTREQELMTELRQNLQTIYLRGKKYQPNHGRVPGQKTWDRATFFIFGGGSHHHGYRHNFTLGLENVGICDPQVHNLPSSQDLTRSPKVEFGRFAVAYGLSFFRPSLDHVRLPQELMPFCELYPEPTDEPPRRYGFNWDD